MLVYSLSFQLRLLVSFFFFNQKTAYELRISDWSSDVCSSDLRNVVQRARNGGSLACSALPLLHPPQMRVDAACARQQRLMRALLHDPPLFDHHEAVRPAHGGQAVGDDQHRAPVADGAHVADRTRVV